MLNVLVRCPVCESCKAHSIAVARDELNDTRAADIHSASPGVLQCIYPPLPCVLWIGAATAAETLTARAINLNRAASNSYEERSNCVRVDSIGMPPRAE